MSNFEAVLGGSECPDVTVYGGLASGRKYDGRCSVQLESLINLHTLLSFLNGAS